MKKWPLALLLLAFWLPFGLGNETIKKEIYEHNVTSDDVDLHIKVARQPVFPTALRSAGYDLGHVSMLLELHFDGELRDWIVTSSNHLSFADAVERVIEDWEFGPPLRNGKPVSLIVPIQVNFKASGDVVSFNSVAGLTHAMTAAFGYDSYNAIEITPIDELDSFPEAISTVTPEAPASLFSQEEDTLGVFRFFIDTQGIVRLAHVDRVEGEVDIRLLEAAQNALEQWRFKPPTVKGRKVVVQALQPFYFYAQNGTR